MIWYVDGGGGIDDFHLLGWMGFLLSKLSGRG